MSTNTLDILVLSDTVLNYSVLKWAIAPFVIPAIYVGGQLISQGVQYFSDKQQQEKNIAAQEKANSINAWRQDEMNRLQRQWALEDWDKQAQYNSPKQTMQRYKEAGLNPNLIYGNVPSSAAPVRASSANPAKYDPVQYSRLKVPDLGEVASGGLAAYQMRLDYDLKQQQLSLLKQQELSNTMKMAGIGIKNASSDLELAKARALYDSTLDAAKLKNEKLKADIESTNLGNKYKPMEMAMKQEQLNLAKAKNARELKQSIVDVARKYYELKHIIPAQRAVIIKKLQMMLSEQKVKEFEARLSEQGFTRSDPAWMRQLLEAFDVLEQDLNLEKYDYNPMDRMLNQHGSEGTW